MIPVRWRASFSYLARHRWQLALSIVGIAIGVAVIVAVDLANASARKAFLLSMDTVTGEATHQVIGGPRGVDAALYRDLRVTHGIDDIAPVIDEQLTINGRRFGVIGIDLFAENAMRSFTAEADSSGDANAIVRDFLALPGAALMSRRSADSLGIGPGDRFTVVTGGQSAEAVLVGLFGGDATSALDELMAVDIATAQAWFGMDELLSRIDVRIDGDASAFRALLPDSATLLDAEGRTQATLDLSAAFMTNLTAMSLLALLIGVFLIYNSVSFSVLQRRGLIGVLRALGMTRREIFVSILGEAAVLGLLASLLGLVAGSLLGEQLLGLVSRSINDLYFRVSVTDVSLDPVTLAKGFIAGMLTSLLAATIPAIEAASLQPRLTLLRSSLEQRAGRALPKVALSGIGIMLAAALLLMLSGRSLAAGLTAVFMLIAGFALCVPLIAKRFAARLESLAEAVGGTASRLAVAGVGSSLSRTGVAIVALAVAVSATIGVSVMVNSFRVSVDDWLGVALRADVYVSGSGLPISDSDRQRVMSLPAVTAASTSRLARIEDASGTRSLLVIDMAPDAYAGTTLLDADPETTWPAWESDDAVLVSEPYAYRFRVSPGDRIDLRTDRGMRAFTVLATYQSFDVNASGLMISRSTYDRHFDDVAIDNLGLYLGDDSDAGAVVEAIEALPGARLSATSNRAIRDLSLDVFDQTFIITDVLYWLATGVALVGILSSMLALQLEKDREQGTLRALGMTRRQIAGLISTQTGVIGFISGLASIPLGLVMAWVLIEVINRRAFGWQIDITISPVIIAQAMLFAVIAALVAGLYPALRAARVEPAIAMREE
ncbi:MAG: FtsX-like permease family protein [Pseudomonadota bacterium]